MFQNAFPGHRTAVQQLVVEDDTVAVLHTHYAHHAGDFMGLAPTGRDVVVEGIELYRLSAGRIVEFWRHDDDAGLMRQLGMVSELA
jgi:predicted ester cyclase